ncbi:MAG: carboxylesterase/lipase family protein [Pseudomonadota bacterium]
MTDTHLTIVQGRIAGQIRNGCRSWLGLPYAGDCSGEQRWQPPAGAPHWRFTRSAGTFGQPCVQHGSAMGAQIPGGFGLGSENCLSLNVYAPLRTTTPKPVMVWIHGGGFAVGASSQTWYDGARLAREHDVVVVTINYRVGVLGFLRLCDVTDGRVVATGNEGLLDQIAALRWVQRNIAEFGGDADNVTIFGESAGGMSVASLMTMPDAKGLFHKAIIQSGRGHAAHPIDDANRVGEAFLALLPDDARRNPASASAKSLVDAAAMLHGRMMFDKRLTIMPTRPVVDGTHLPELPITAMRNGNGHEVPLLIGYNKNEWRYFAQVDRAMRRLSHDQMMDRLRYHFRDGQIDTLLQAYAYEPDKERETFRVYSAIFGGAAFVASTRQIIAAHIERQPVYAYRFDRPAPGMGGLLGACHVTEIPFVFGTLDQMGRGVLFEDSPASWRLSQQVRHWWTQFAHTGEPALGQWPTFNDEPGEWRINDTTQFVPAEDTPREQFWRTVSDKQLVNI